MAQCRDCGKEYEGAAIGESGLCPTCMPRWLASAQATAADYAHQWQQERMRAESLAEINRELLAACEAVMEAWAKSWDCSRDPGHQEMYEPIKQMRAAIAKARP